MDIVVDGSRPILRINDILRSLIEPTNLNNDNESVEKENLGDQSKESFYDKSNDILGDDSMNKYDHSVDVEEQPVDEEHEFRSKPNHSFFDGTNFYMHQTFSIKSELQLLLAEATTRKSFDFATKFENLRVNHHCGDSLYLYYNAAKTYSLEEFNNHFAEFKDKYPEVLVVLKHEVDFEKGSRAHFTGSMYDVMIINITESLNAMLIDEREYPVTSIFNSIAKRFGELFRERHAYVLKSKGLKWCRLAK
ncbi:hypothetical protein H5410_060642 [Solanum commersonii]|uniref:Uncharacterized protein n=1 Tax=Solanum commersonii TaxID=4109 RepID=A0A9J5W6N3_SOLCO|nr:hypothetical protein H5410_060642 [Solanum commersonii]